mgnify:CR=1 FL=1
MGVSICYIHIIIERDDPKIIIFGNDTEFYAVRADGNDWQSRRLSLDGMRNISADSSTLTGEAWEPIDNWYPFKVDLLTGAATGGSYFEQNDPHVRNDTPVRRWYHFFQRFF